MTDNASFRMTDEEGTFRPSNENGSFKLENYTKEPIKMDIERSLSDSATDTRLTYEIDDIPPWYLCIFLGLQHYLTMFGSTMSIPYLLAPALCIASDDPARGHMISTIIFVSGLVTLLQSTFGVRLPIIQGGTFSFLIPTFAILNLPKWKCPTLDGVVVNGTHAANDSLIGVDTDEIWQSRMREVQGAIVCSSLFQVILGSTGLVGLLLKFLTPLSIAPVISLVGLSLFENATTMASGNWIVSFSTTILMIIFSQYMRKLNIPCALYTKSKGCHSKGLALFNLFPVLLAIVIVWISCTVITHFDAFSANDPARTDTNIEIVIKAPWFRVPYPGQWGLPTVSIAGVLGMLGGCLASTIESVGDYYACARLSGAPRPPVHAINRGITVEGIGCVLAGIWGSGNGTTSYGENIAVIGVTKVASRRVIQSAAIIMLIAGSLSKFSALFVTIPSPIVGGTFFIMFAFVTAVGLSNLQFVDLNSTRNLFVIGFPLFFGLSVPRWLQKNPSVINTGNIDVDNILTVLLTTSMFVGGVLGIFLDNTIPGTAEERGLLKWNADKNNDTNTDETQTTQDVYNKNCYDLPFGMNYIRRWKFVKYFPISPTYEPGKIWSCFRKHS